MSLDTWFSLRDQIVVVTGASGMLGSSFSRAIAAAGGRVAMLDVVPVDVAEHGLNGDQATFVHCDITDDAAVRDALAAVESVFGTPTGLVNCAAIDAPPHTAGDVNGPFEDFPSVQFDAVLEVNLQGAVRCCQVFGGAMAKAGRGSIVNVASTYGIVGPDQRLYEHLREQGTPFYKPAVYTASKAALIGFTRYLASYWADQGVRVNTLTPGGVYAGQDQRFVDAYTSRTPLGRMADVDDYDGAVVFLLSGASAYMTGSNMVVDGGYTIW